MTRKELRAVLAACAIAAVILLAMAVFHISGWWLVITVVLFFSFA